MYWLKTPSQVVSLILWLLALRVDLSSLEEAYGISESTLRTWLSRSGVNGQKLHQRFLSGLDRVHVQLDQLWAEVKHARHETWVWLLLSDLGYGQVVKHQRRRKLVKVERSILCGDKDAYRERLKATGLSGRINSSLVER